EANEDRGRKIAQRLPRRVRADREGNFPGRYTGSQQRQPALFTVPPRAASDLSFGLPNKIFCREAHVNRARDQVIALAATLNLVSYLDRVCISVAAPSLRREFGFTPLELGQVFSAFSLSYALFQAPWGMAADRFGPRGIVALGIFAWSLFTGWTAASWNLFSLLAIRFAFGA